MSLILVSAPSVLPTCRVGLGEPCLCQTVKAELLALWESLLLPLVPV